MLWSKKKLENINRLNLQDLIREKCPWTQSKSLFFKEISNQRIVIEIRPGEDEYYRQHEVDATFIMDLETWQIEHKYRDWLSKQDYFTKSDIKKLFTKSWI